MRKILTIRFGSHLYGTSTPASDLDFKSVHIPLARDILLQRVRGSVSTKRPKAEGEKNYAGEVDEESYSLQRFLGLAAEGQTVALDVLFAPDCAAVEPPSIEWRQIILNRRRLLTKRSAAFVGYCRQQCNKYGIKGSRVATARSALKLLDAAVTAGAHQKLAEYESSIGAFVDSHEHTAVTPIEQASGTVIKHWDVCGRKLQFSTSVKHARDVVQRLVDEYGHRAIQAERQEGVDWKAMSHAVRVGTQAIEFLRTAHITFPLPNAEHILAIKTGRLPYQEVASEIEALLEDVERESAASSLPDEPDREWIDEFVTKVYRSEVCGWRA